MVFVFSRIVFFAFRRFYMAYNETPTLERQAMFTFYLNAMTSILFPLHFLQDDEAFVYIEYQMYMLPKFISGELKSMKDIVKAQEEFMNLLLDLDKD